MAVIHRAVAAFAAAGTLVGVVALTAPSAVAAPAHMHAPFLASFNRLRTIGPTIPKNGDVNPYGMVVVKHSEGRLQAGNVLISNFNDKANLQGTGSTIVELSPRGRLVLFAKITKAMLSGPCPGGIGLTTALVLLRGGWVVVGSTPSTNGQATTSGPGCLIVLDNRGRVRETISGHGINGPWDAAAVSTGRSADVFVTNVLNGTVKGNGKVVNRGTVLRLHFGLSESEPPALMNVTKIGSGFSEETSTTAFVVGPTGVGIGDGTLFVADTVNSRITAIPDALQRQDSAGTGMVVTSGGALSGPLGLTVAPNGDILTVNGGNGKVVETTPAGMQVATRLLDKSGSPAGSGALFGLAVAPDRGGLYYVDDATNRLRLLHGSGD